MSENYTFPVILDKNEPGFINIYFPDFDMAVTSVELGEDPIEEAQSWLAITISELIDEGKTVPNPSHPDQISTDTNQTIVFVNIWLPYHRSKERIIYVKKTLTIPSYLDILARESNINFSETLSNALKQKLGIK